MTKSEVTQSLHLAQTLNLIVSSRTINGMLYVYNSAGYAQPWESFSVDYPLERLLAMVERAQARRRAAS